MDKLNAMRAFVAVANHRNFTRAAQDIGMPRSTLSETILLLETTWGARLLTRTTRRVSLTEVGRKFYASCVAILNAVSSLDDVGSWGRADSPVHLVVSDLLVDAWLMPILKRYRQTYPDAAFRVDVANAEISPAQSVADCLVLIGTAPPAGYESEVLARLDGVTVASAAYVQAIDSGESPGSVMTPNLYAGLATALHGLGAARLPRNLVAAALGSGQLREFPDEQGDAADHVILLAYPEFVSLRPDIASLVAWMRAAFLAPDPRALKQTATKGAGHPVPSQEQDLQRAHVQALLRSYASVG
jgi:DNA-binding transcriptional LysR family regulator